MRIATQSNKLTARKAGAIGWIGFNDPEKHNAISLDMAQAIIPVMEDFNADDAIRVIVLYGEGNRSFAAGSNISSFGAVRETPEQNAIYHSISEQAYDSFYLSPKPTIAMIKGYCIGGGLDFAASCDIRICSDTASFAIPAGRLGVGYGYEGLIRTNRIIGPSKGRDIFFSARRYHAQEALQMGLVHEVVALDDIESHTTRYAETVAANAPLTLQAIKQSFIEQERDARAVDMTVAQRMIDRCFTSEDYKEGRAAFAEKRAPKFKGK